MKNLIDLHLHLDGAIDLDIAKKLATIQNIKIDKSDEELKDILTLSENCQSLDEFLKRFAFPLTLLQTKEGITQGIYLVLEKAKKDGVIYAEIRFAPQFHCQKGLNQEEVIKAAIDGLKLSSIRANLILCLMRGQGNEKENEETLNLARKYFVENNGVVAIDLAGAEALYSTDNYKHFFEKAKEYNIPYTIHGGEAAGAESVRQAIEYGAKRIGHGVRTKEDENVLKLAKEKGVFFEMCPTSNIQTRAINDLTKYPLLYYLEYGINVTLNTDNPAIQGISLSHEFEIMEKYLGLTKEQEIKILQNSINAAFTDQETKDYLRKEIEKDID